jgi:hypothetical protein
VLAQRSTEVEPAPPGRLRARTVAVSAIDAAAREAMWRVFERTYADVDRARFEDDLAAKQHAILLHDERDGSLQGFSTLQVYRRELDGRRFVVVYSGDTVIAPGYWGQRALQVAFVRFVITRKLLHPLLPVYWFLISKGYKTYLLLSRNFPEHWPRRDRPTPPWPAAVLALVAREKFGDAFVAERGILQFDTPMGRLRAGVAPIGAPLLEDPDVRFFAERNPGHARGDELCCLGRVSLRQGIFFTTRLLRRALGRRR